MRLCKNGVPENVRKELQISLLGVQISCKSSDKYYRNRSGVLLKARYVFVTTESSLQLLLFCL